MPVYCYKCNVCGLELDHARSVNDRDAVCLCPADHDGMPCPGGLHRNIGAELPSMLKTEKRFKPYHDIGTGQYYKTRAARDADWKARGLVGLTGREIRQSYEDTLHATERADAKVKREFPKKWAAAVEKGQRKAYDRRKIVVEGK